LKGFFV